MRTVMTALREYQRLTVASEPGVLAIMKAAAAMSPALDAYWANMARSASRITAALDHLVEEEHDEER